MATILASPRHSVEATSAGQVTWQAALKRAIRDGHALCDALGVSRDLANAEAESEFPVFVPLEYLQRMRPGDPADPLLRQVLGTGVEVRADRGGWIDPVGDEAARKGPTGLLQKYARRVLLITTGACAVHCRYCFRRHFPYDTAALGKPALSDALLEIAQDPSIDEVILSGGDPLTLADESLSWLMQQLNEIGHIRRIRIHTRVPVVIPQRVCPALLDWVEASQSAVYFVMHLNHAREIDATVTEAFAQLRRVGAVLLNQAVLLAGVNDSVQAQVDLCRQLVDRGVLPYYLHQLDPVRGALHFAVSDQLALEILSELRTQLPGYAVPKLVREIPGEASKTPL